MCYNVDFHIRYIHEMYLLQCVLCAATSVPVVY